MFVAQTYASALVFNHSSELCILVYIIYDLVINDKQTRNSNSTKLDRNGHRRNEEKKMRDNFRVFLKRAQPAFLTT